jgi:ABC-type branched-subunit amino acid transport system permease subunit
VILARLVPLTEGEHAALEGIQPSPQPESKVRRILRLAHAAFLGLGAAWGCVIFLGRLVPQAIRTGEWKARGTTYHRTTTPIRFWLALAFVSVMGIFSGCVFALLAFTIPAHL